MIIYTYATGVLCGGCKAKPQHLKVELSQRGEGMAGDGRI